mmetsp:Transcript_22222/g.43808  ORF Transcript_22222/g.43808 Transcript_22222/m.43808 type:complete len:344 (+) Transcript_22222:1043-2074(+)
MACKAAALTMALCEWRKPRSARSKRTACFRAACRHASAFCAWTSSGKRATSPSATSTRAMPYPVSMAVSTAADASLWCWLPARCFLNGLLEALASWVSTVLVADDKASDDDHAACSAEVADGSTWSSSMQVSALRSVSAAERGVAPFFARTLDMASRRHTCKFAEAKELGYVCTPPEPEPSSTPSAKSPSPAPAPPPGVVLHRTTRVPRGRGVLLRSSSKRSSRLLDSPSHPAHDPLRLATEVCGACIVCHLDSAPQASARTAQLCSSHAVSPPAPRGREEPRTTSAKRAAAGLRRFGCSCALGCSAMALRAPVLASASPSFPSCSTHESKGCLRITTSRAQL